MELKIQGILRKKLEIESGVSKSDKEWKKQNFLIETQDQYPKTICFTLFADKMEKLQYVKEGDLIEVYFNLESREYNGKYYHNLNAWMLKKLEVESQDVQDAETIDEAPPLPNENNPLPF